MDNEIEIILDTETTGFDPMKGDRLVEIGCVEIKNRMPTGNVYHQYINPERDVPEAAFKVHGISTEFLQDKPKFAEIADDFLKFISGKKLVIHNAEFDMKFINHELKAAGKKAVPNELVFCTLIHARKKFPGQQNSLDALCKRFNVNNSHRDKHGALLDSEILAEVYLELMGGKQVTLLGEEKSDQNNTSAKTKQNSDNTNKNFKTLLKSGTQKIETRLFEVDANELAAHDEMISKLKNPIWKRTQQTS